MQDISFDIQIKWIWTKSIFVLLTVDLKHIPYSSNKTDLSKQKKTK